jgi:transketolase
MTVVIDTHGANAIRMLTIDSVQQANSGATTGRTSAASRVPLHRTIVQAPGKASVAHPDCPRRIE